MMRTSREKVMCGIVTFNPELERLSKNLDAVVSQVDRVYIYDNCSKNKEELSRVLAEHGVASVCWAAENGGMAVALNNLARFAKELGYEYVLFLDQDSVAASNLVEVLLDNTGDDVAITAPKIVDINGKGEEDLDVKVSDVRRAITSGTLLKLSAFENVGGYDERLFVDWVDYEFCIALRSAGYRIRAVPDTYILHDFGNNKEVGCKIPMRAAAGGIKLHPFYRYNYPDFRIFDMGRSRAITIEKYKGTPEAKKEREDFIFSSLIHLLIERNRFHYMSVLLKGYKDGKRIARDS